MLTRADASLNRVVRSGCCEKNHQHAVTSRPQVVRSHCWCEVSIKSVLTADSVSAENLCGKLPHLPAIPAFGPTQEVHLNSICSSLTSSPAAYPDTGRTTPSILASIGSCPTCARHSPGRLGQNFTYLWSRRFQRPAATTFVAITGHADDAGRKAAFETRLDIHVPRPADASKLEQFLIERRATIRHPQ